MSQFLQNQQSRFWKDLRNKIVNFSQPEQISELINGKQFTLPSLDEIDCEIGTGDTNLTEIAKFQSDTSPNKQDIDPEYFSSTDYNQIQRSEVSKLLFRSDMYTLFADEEMFRQEISSFQNQEWEKLLLLVTVKPAGRFAKIDEISSDPGVAGTSNICMYSTHMFSTHNFPTIKTPELVEMSVIDAHVGFENAKKT